MADMGSRQVVTHAKERIILLSRIKVAFLADLLAVFAEDGVVDVDRRGRAVPASVDAREASMGENMGEQEKYAKCISLMLNRVDTKERIRRDWNGLTASFNGAAMELNEDPYHA